MSLEEGALAVAFTGSPPSCICSWKPHFMFRGRPASQQTVNEKLMTSGGISHPCCSGHVVQVDGSLSGCEVRRAEVCYWLVVTQLLLFIVKTKQTWKQSLISGDKANLS